MSRPAFWIDALALGTQGSQMIICIIWFFEQLFLFAIIWLVYDILASHSSSHVFLLSEQTPSPWYLCVILCPHGPSPLSPSSLSPCLPKDHLHLSISIPRVTFHVSKLLSPIRWSPSAPSPQVLILKQYATLCHGRPGGATSEGHMRWWGEMGRLGRGWMRRL